MTNTLISRVVPRIYYGSGGCSINYVTKAEWLANKNAFVTEIYSYVHYLYGIYKFMYSIIIHVVFTS